MTAEPSATYVLDANLLLRLANKSDPARSMVGNAVISLLSSGVLMRTIPQTLFEFWVAATRPLEKNGLALSIADAESELLSFLKSFPLLPDDPTLVTHWRHLVVRHGVSGKQAHDARYVAAMQAHGVTHLLTMDADFRRYLAEGITIVDPAQVPLFATEHGE